MSDKAKVGMVSGALEGGGLVRLGTAYPARLVLWVIAVSTGLRLIIAWAVGSDFNEAYFISAARHFQLSYFDHPPLSFWLIAVTMKLTGSDSVFVLRTPFILISAGTTWLVYRLGCCLFNRSAGAFASLLLNLSPVFTIGTGMLLLPDSPLMPCLLAMILCIARLVRGPIPSRPLLTWAAAGMWFGLAMLSKYSAALTVAGVAIFALTSREHRRWFIQPGPYLAGLIAVLVFSPVLVWNWQNGWISLTFQGERIVSDQGLQPMALLDSILGQAAWVGPWVWAPLVYVYGLALARGPRETPSWFLSCTAMLPIVLFTASAYWAPEAGHRYHWQAPGYLLLFPLLGQFVVQKLREKREPMRQWLTASLMITVVVVAVLVTHVRTGWLQHLAAQFSSRAATFHDPTLQMLDWNELRPALVRSGLLDRPTLFIVTTHRYEAGKVDVQLGSYRPVLCLCYDPRNGPFQWDQRAFLGWDALIIGRDLSLAAVQQEYGPYFRRIVPFDKVDIHRSAQVELNVAIYYATDYYRLYPLPEPTIR